MLVCRIANPDRSRCFDSLLTVGVTWKSVHRPGSSSSFSIMFVVQLRSPVRLYCLSIFMQLLAKRC